MGVGAGKYLQRLGMEPGARAFSSACEMEEKFRKAMSGHKRLPARLHVVRGTAQPCRINKDEPKAPDKAMRHARSLMAGFGLSPANRARISARDVQKAGNPSEKLING